MSDKIIEPKHAVIEQLESELQEILITEDDETKELVEYITIRMIDVIRPVYLSATKTFFMTMPPRIARRVLIAVANSTVRMCHELSTDE